MDSDKTAAHYGLSGSSQCPAGVDQGAPYPPPIRWHPDDADDAASGNKKLLDLPCLVDLLDWPDSTMLGEWELRSHSPVQPCTPVPTQAGPVQPFRFVGHLRSARWAPACPITIRCLGLAPTRAEIAAVLTPALPSCSLHPHPPTPDPGTPSSAMTAAIVPPR
jgi:hypothetical protein